MYAGIATPAWVVRVVHLDTHIIHELDLYVSGTAPNWRQHGIVHVLPPSRSHTNAAPMSYLGTCLLLTILLRLDRWHDTPRKSSSLDSRPSSQLRSRLMVCTTLLQFGCRSGRLTALYTVA